MSALAAAPRAPDPAAPTAGRQAFRRLETWLYSAPSKRLGLPQIERESERRGRELLRLLLQAHLDGRGSGDVGVALRVSAPDGSPLFLTHRRLHTRRLITLFGAVSVSRMGYGCPGQASVHPLDAELELPARTYSYEIQRRLVKAAVQGPFDEALGLLWDTNGVGVPKRSAEQILVEAAVDFDSFYVQHTDADDPQAQGPILVGAIDCKGIPMVKPQPAAKAVRLKKGEKRQKKRMSTVAAVFSQQPEPRTPEAVIASLFAPQSSSTQPRRRSRPLRKRIWASLLAGKDAFIADVRAEMLRRDPRRKKTWVIVTDGERALQRRVCKLFGDITLVLDLLHVLEKLWAAAYTLHPEGSPQAEGFVRERALRILRGQVSQVVKGLRQMVTKRRFRGQRRKTLLGVAAYYYRNRSRMRYDLYLVKGWPIASGSVEGACKNLIKDRMERSGMRWTLAMAEAMLRLRAIYLSGDFEPYWEYHVRQDQQRLHPRLWTVVRK